MDDLISRQAAIDALCDNCDHVEAVCPHYPCKQYIAIENLPSAQPEQKWVSVKERLPEYGQAVLVSLDGGSMTDGVRSADYAGRSVWDCALDNRTWYGDENIVIAWMPLPEPYKEGEKWVT